MPPLATFEFRHIARSNALDAHARALSSRVSRLDSRITGCHVILEELTEPSGSDAPYVVKIELNVPGAHIRADSRHPDGAGHAALLQALRAAYENARLQLQNLHCGWITEPRPGQ